MTLFCWGGMCVFLTCLMFLNRPQEMRQQRVLFRKGDQVQAHLVRQEERFLSTGEVYHKAVYSYTVENTAFQYTTRIDILPPETINLFFWPGTPEKASTCGQLPQEW